MRLCLLFKDGRHDDVFSLGEHLLDEDTAGIDVLRVLHFGQGGADTILAVSFGLQRQIEIGGVIKWYMTSKWLGELELLVISHKACHGQLYNIDWH